MSAFILETVTNRPSPFGPFLFLVSLLFSLKPFTSYQFRVKATNDIGDSEYSEESEAITTLQDGRMQSLDPTSPNSD